jgi:hypothetical protein
MSKKTKLGEAPIEYTNNGNIRMSPDIEAKLKSREHPLGAHKAFPDIDQDGKADNFEELIATKRFQEVVEKVKNATGLEMVDQESMMDIQHMMMRSAQELMSIEASNLPELEALAVKVVVDQMSLPEGDLQFDVKIMKPDASGMQAKPKKKKKKEPEQEQPEIDDDGLQDRMDKLDMEKQKRRFINSLIQGSSKKAHYMYHMVSEELNAINSKLIGLYSLVMSVNDLMYWIMPDMDAMMGNGGEEAIAGKEELDLTTDPPTIKARGLFFPILVHEVWKGVMEYMSAHGLPSDPEFAGEVMDETDTLTAEVWDLRLGPVIWEKFIESYPEELINNTDMGRIKNYLYFNIISMDAEPFLILAKEILSGSQKGKNRVAKIVNEIIEQLKSEDYEDVSGDYEREEVTSTPSEDSEIDFSTLGKTQPTKKEVTVELDMDTILDKINKVGMSALTKEEKDFLFNL